MQRWIPFLTVSCLILLSPAALLAAAASNPGEIPTSLSIGKEVSDTLAAEELHNYTVELKADRFVRGHVDQHSVDVAITVYGPDAAIVTATDVTDRGPDRFQFDSKAPGSYRIEIRALKGEAGDYTIIAEAVEPTATKPKKRVDQLMAAYAGEDVPGGVVAVIQAGKVTFAKAYGAANLSHSIPFTRKILSNIGSTSKQFTAFSIMLLVKQGNLSLDDDVRAYIPELPDFGDTVRVRNLLTHTSGYREFLNTLAMGGRILQEGDYIDRDEVIGVVQRQPELQNSPGAEWNYNNTAFSLLTTIVERITEQSFPAWVKEHVFTPLGMDHSVIRAHRMDVIPNSAQGYAPMEGGYREVLDLGGAMGAGGIYTTVDDLAKWIRNLHTGELGGPDIIQQMTTPFVLSNGDTTQYGFGLFIDTYKGLKRIHHGGADTAHRAMLMYFPELDAGVVTLSNNAAFNGGIATQVADLFLGDHMETEETATSQSEASDEEAVFDPAQYDTQNFDLIAGRYELEEAPGFILTFSREEDKFLIQATGQPKVDMVPTSDSTFALTAVEASLTFHFEADGSVNSLTLHQNGEHPANRLKEDPWEPSAQELADYAGRYFSEELETFYTVAVEENALVLKHRRMEDMKLVPAKKDTFNAAFPIGELAFQRDETGRITGFTGSNGRTKGIRFDRQD